MLDVLRSLHRPPATLATGAIAITVFAAIGGRLLLDILRYSPDLWLVDLVVYRDAGESVLTGRHIYDWLTPTPQLLPFTYPPISAIFAVPLTWLPLRPLGWIWTAAQLALLAGVTAVAYRPLLRRFGRHALIALAALIAILLWMLPLRSTISFGQVNIIILALVAADYLVSRPRWPRGALIGVATAIKLTPAVFIVHLWLAGQRREATTASVTAVGLTLAAAAVLPHDSVAFWLDAILASDRVGPNDGTSNQSIRGILLRFELDSVLIWLPLAALVAWFGFRAAVRASRARDPLAACAIVGLLAVLLSPVAWIHHMSWLVLALAVIVRDGRSVARIALAAGLWYVFYASLPWLGRSMGEGNMPIILARLVEGSYGLIAIGLIFLLGQHALHDESLTAQVKSGSHVSWARQRTAMRLSGSRRS